MPSGFLWGAATSAHQVEGHNIYNDWWAWEQARAKHLQSGAACDHYRRYKEDFALAQQLGHNAHRLSLEWSRIEPKRGEWSRPAINHYRDVLQELKVRGMKRCVTLHHFTNPRWIAERGGWLSSETTERFAQYTRFVTQQLGDEIDLWVTINEPVVYALQSYLKGVWPPQQKNFARFLAVTRHMASAHRQAYRIIHQYQSSAKVGIAKHLVAYLPEHVGQLDDQLVAMIEDWWFNHRFFSLIAGTYDFIGVNYYFPRKLRVHMFPPSVRSVPWQGLTSDMGWPIQPQGLTHVLLHMKRYGKPLYVTENGLADADDSRRGDFIRSHLRAVEKAQQQGADVRGYFHWSLLDNFEWDDGFAPRFGLIAVDYKTLQRTIRPSAYVYKAIIAQADSTSSR